jgi:spermidine synthase
MLFSLFKKPIKSKIHGTITFLTIKGNKALRAGGVTHSGGEIWPMWQEVFKLIKNDESQIMNCLLLGVGGGDVLKIVQKQYSKAHITGVEIDPKMVEVATRDFGLTLQKNNKIIITDAIDWVNKHPGKKYDLIINDLYIGPLNPIQTRQKKYIQRLKTMLTQKGVLIYNAHYQKNDTQEFDVFMDMVGSLFSQVEIAFSYPLNRVLILKK